MALARTPARATHRPASLPHDVEQALVEQRMALDHAGVGIALVRQRRVVSCNQRFAEIFDHADAAAMVGVSTVTMYVDDADYHDLGVAAYPVMASGQPYRAEHLMVRRGGVPFWAHLTGTLIDPSDTLRGSVWIVEDIDEQRRAREALAEVREQHQIILDNAMVGIVVLRERRVTHCNRAFEQLFGWGPGELTGRLSREWYLTDEEWEEGGRRCYEPFKRGEAFVGEMVLRHRDGHPIVCEVRSKAIDPNRLELGSIWITMDITARKRAEDGLREAQADLERQVRERTEQLHRTVKALEQKVREQEAADARIQRLAHYDALTGLPNRSLLEDRCRHLIHAAGRHGQSVAVMFIDLDHFKTVNDSLGHRVGDAVLVSLAQRLRKEVRAQDTVARLGGDEFVLLLPETDADGAACVAQKIVAAAQEPFPGLRPRAHGDAVGGHRPVPERRRRPRRPGACGRRGHVPRQGGRPQHLALLPRPNCRPIPTARCWCPTRCAARSSATSSRSPSSPRWTWTAAASSAPRPCCAGSTPTWAGFPRPSSSRSPSPTA